MSHYHGETACCFLSLPISPFLQVNKDVYLTSERNRLSLVNRLPIHRLCDTNKQIYEYILCSLCTDAEWNIVIEWITRRGGGSGFKSWPGDLPGFELIRG